MAKAVISGDFASYRPVMSRKILQIIIEVPIEAQQAVFEALGFPIGGGSIPVAIARLQDPELPRKLEEMGEGSEGVFLVPASTGNVGFSIGGRSPPTTVTLGPQRDEAGPFELPDLGPVTYSAHFAPDASEEEIAEASEWARRGNEMEDQKRAAESAKSKLAPAVQQAGIVCKEPAFWAFLRPFLDHEGPIDEACAADFVRRWCRVQSRAEITPGSEAERRWNKLFLNYGQWRHVHEGK